MADTIACPECGRALRVTEELYGQEVRCPMCATTFIAERPAPPLPTYTVREQPAPPRRRAEDDAPALRRFARESGSGQPHRGGTILTLGILSLVTACCFLTGWLFGGIALAMANNDLRKMASGDMDRAGRGLTQAGKVCALLGVLLSTMAFCLTFGTRYLRRF